AGPTGATGTAGPQGIPGPAGPSGQGVPAGGVTGAVLTKLSATDYDTSWQTPAAAGSFPLRRPADSRSAPDYALAPQPNTGLYQPAIGQIGLAVGGTAIARASSTSFAVGGTPSTTTLDVTGTFHATGNTSLGGTLGVSGATTASGLLTAQAGVSVTGGAI